MYLQSNKLFEERRCGLQRDVSENTADDMRSDINDRFSTDDFQWDGSIISAVQHL